MLPCWKFKRGPPLDFSVHLSHFDANLPLSKQSKNLIKLVNSHLLKIFVTKASKNNNPTQENDKLCEASRIDLKNHQLCTFAINFEENDKLRKANFVIGPEEKIRPTCVTKTMDLVRLGKASG
jgi:hypothetical protein